MNTIELLDKLQRQAMSDEKLRKELLETRKAENPLGAFCRKCRELAMRSMRWNWSLQEKNFMRR